MASLSLKHHSMTITDEQLRTDLYQAYFDAREHKRNTLAQLNFEIFCEHYLEDLYRTLRARTYKPLPPYCFITFDPVQREVYASQFRDRVVQHMLFNYLAPFYEPLFIHDTYSCRIGKGTLFGIERYRHHLRSVTDNFTKEAWVLYLDLSGYFMSIDRQLVITTIMDRIVALYGRRSPDGRAWGEILDPDFISYMLHCQLDRNPSDNCIKLGNPHDWDGLPERKRLACSPPGHGIVIGDITSQLFSNVLLDIYDQWVKRELKIRHYGHYVDDMYHMHRSRRFLLDSMPLMEQFLEERLHVKVNHDKWRLLPASAANQYLGAYVRPFYTVPRQRTINKFCRVMKELEIQLMCQDVTQEELLRIRARVNSYLGLLKHYRTYNLRKGQLNRSAFDRYFYFDKGYTRAILRPEYGGKTRPASSLYIPFRDKQWLAYLDDPSPEAFPPCADGQNSRPQVTSPVTQYPTDMDMRQSLWRHM